MTQERSNRGRDAFRGALRAVATASFTAAALAATATAATATVATATAATGTAAPTVGLAAALAAIPQETDASEDAAALQGATYMRTAGDTVIRNFEDRNGAALATLPKGTLVRAFRESQGRPVFSEVEVAGGVPVWVYGRYLQPTDVDGVLLVTGNRVNMRPMPNATPAAMPLRSKLDAGQRVKLIERANKAVAFGEDWIRVQSPSSAKAWIESSALQPVIDERAASAEWLDKTQPLPVARPRRVTTSDASAPRTDRTKPAEDDVDRVPAATLQLLVQADELYDAARALQSPTVEAWADVCAAYGAVMEAAPATSITYQKAYDRLQQAKAKRDFVALREEIIEAQQKSDREIQRIDEMLEAQRQRKTARWGRFEERGWLESRTVAGGTRWYLVYGGETVAELRCLTGRYDLDLFEGYELGIIGREVAPVVRGTRTSLPEARVVDAQRIEVISARGR